MPTPAPAPTQHDDIKRRALWRLGIAGGFIVVAIATLLLLPRGENPQTPVATQEVPPLIRDHTPAPLAASVIETSPPLAALSTEPSALSTVDVTAASMAVSVAENQVPADLAPPPPQVAANPVVDDPARPVMIGPKPTPALPQPVATPSKPNPVKLATPTTPPTPIAAPAPLPAKTSRPKETVVVLQDPPPNKVEPIVDSVIPRPKSEVLRAPKGYVVQLGLFASHANADELQARLALQGIKTYTETRVHVGVYPDKKEAEKNLAKLKAMGVKAVVVPSY